MFQAIYNSLSGLFSFSRSLDTISNNVANMNTVGFRGSDSFFENVGGGLGTRIDSTGLRTQTGERRQTGNWYDAAIDGNGFYVLRDPNGNLYYTRAGQFRLDENGILTDSITGYEVLAIDEAGNLNRINTSDQAFLDPEATTEVNLSGLVPPPALELENPIVVTSTAITVYDKTGAARKLFVTIRCTGDRLRYDVTVKDEDGNLVGEEGAQLRFNGLGNARRDYDSVLVTLGEEGQEQEITLSFAGVRALDNTAGSLGGTAVDGHAPLPMQSRYFDENGVLQYVYGPDDTVAGQQLALASFVSEAQLELIGDRLLVGTAAGDVVYGRPGEGSFGHITGGSLEMGNVDLTLEFADMIIIQRGYQASSRVMTVSNELIENLYNSTRG